MSAIKQGLLFDLSDSNEEQPYSKKIEAPVYIPTGPRPHLLALVDTTKTKRLVAEIDESDLPEDEKIFLRAAAWRHAVFHYERIAEYYAHASPATQRLMEASALVIIDFDAAIERGFVRLSSEIERQFMEEYVSHE